MRCDQLSSFLIFENLICFTPFSSELLCTKYAQEQRTELVRKSWCIRAWKWVSVCHMRVEMSVLVLRLSVHFFSIRKLTPHGSIGNMIWRRYRYGSNTEEKRKHMYARISKWRGTCYWCRLHAVHERLTCGSDDNCLPISSEMVLAR